MANQPNQPTGPKQPLGTTKEGNQPLGPTKEGSKPLGTTK
jgi:hypothetical protein